MNSENGPTTTRVHAIGSRLCGLAGVKYFSNPDGPHIVGANRNQRNYLAATIDKFLLVPLAALVDMHDEHVTF